MICGILRCLRDYKNETQYVGVLRDHRLQMQNHKKFTSCHGNARPDNTWIRIIKHQHKKTKTKVQETDLGPPTSKTAKVGP